MIGILHCSLQRVTEILRSHSPKRSHCSIEKEKEEKLRMIVCDCEREKEKRESCHSHVPSVKRRARLKRQLVIWLSSPDWEERRRIICRPLQSFIGPASFCFVFCSSQKWLVFFPLVLLSFSLSETTGVCRMTVIRIVVFLHKYNLIQMYWMQLSYSVF